MDPALYVVKVRLHQCWIQRHDPLSWQAGDAAFVLWCTTGCDFTSWMPGHRADSRWSCCQPGTPDPFLQGCFPATSLPVCPGCRIWYLNLLNFTLSMIIQCSNLPPVWCHQQTCKNCVYIMSELGMTEIFGCLKWVGRTHWQKLVVKVDIVRK